MFLYETPWGLDAEPVEIRIIDRLDNRFGTIPYIQSISGSFAAIDGACELKIECLWSEQINTLMPCKGDYLIHVKINGAVNVYVPREVTISGDDTDGLPRVTITAVDGGGVVYGLPRPLIMREKKAPANEVAEAMFNELIGGTIAPRREFLTFLRMSVTPPTISSHENQDSDSIGDSLRLALAARGWALKVRPLMEGGAWRIALFFILLKDDLDFTISQGNGHISSWELSSYGPEAKEIVADVGGGTQITSAKTAKGTSGWEYRGKNLTANTSSLNSFFNQFAASSVLRVQLAAAAPFSIGQANSTKRTFTGSIIDAGDKVKFDLGQGLTQTSTVTRIEFEQTPTSFTMTPVLSDPRRSVRGVWQRLEAQGKALDFVRARV